MAEIENIHCPICTQPIPSSWQNALPPALATDERRGEARYSYFWSIMIFLTMMLLAIKLTAQSICSCQPCLQDNIGQLPRLDPPIQARRTASTVLPTFLPLSPLIETFHCFACIPFHAWFSKGLPVQPACWRDKVLQRQIFCRTRYDRTCVIIRHCCRCLITIV